MGQQDKYPPLHFGPFWTPTLPMCNQCPDLYFGLKFHFQVPKRAIIDDLCKTKFFHMQFSGKMWTKKWKSVQLENRLINMKTMKNFVSQTLKNDENKHVLMVKHCVLFQLLLLWPTFCFSSYFCDLPSVRGPTSVTYLLFQLLFLWPTFGFSSYSPTSVTYLLLLWPTFFFSCYYCSMLPPCNPSYGGERARGLEEQL